MKIAGSSICKILILVALSYIFFMMGNSILYLTNPDEVFYAQTAKEMAQRNTWMVPYLFGQPQFEKPILIYWLIRISYIFLGDSDFSVRFFSSLFGIIGVIAIYLLALLGYRDKKRAFISALVLLSSGIYIGMARIILTDVIFTVFILLSILSFYWGYAQENKKTTGLYLFYVFSALAVLTKGPLGFIIPLLIIILFLCIIKELNFFFCRHSLLGFLVFLFMSVPWYAFVIYKYGNLFMQEFFYNDHVRRIFEAEHKKFDTWYFYPSIMFIGMFPWCLYAFFSFLSFIKKIWKRNISAIEIFIACWILVVFIIFQPAHSKLISYVLPLFPALAMITGNYICSKIMDNKKILELVGLGTWFILMLFPAGILYLPREYTVYLPPLNLLYPYIFAYMILLLAMVVFIIREKYLTGIYFLVLQILLILFFVPIASNNFNAYLSSGDAGEYLVKNYSIGTVILSKKFFARGIRYYTGKEVAVWGGEFFSPHPVSMLDSDERVMQFLRKQPVTFCVLSKSSYEDLERIVKDYFKVDLLKIIGEQYIARVQIC